LEPVTLGKSVWLPWRVFVMPGSTIGDGTVIGANSLVAGNIPPNSLAVGSPAKVIRSAPDFPKRLSESERSTLVATIMAEFDRFVQHSGVRVEAQGSVRLYHYRRRWRLLWLRGRARMVCRRPAGDAVLETTFWRRRAARLREAGRLRLDLGGRTRSRGGSRLTEELALFIGRYGVRLARHYDR
jgi:hypothetical protein